MGALDYGENDGFVFLLFGELFNLNALACRDPADIFSLVFLCLLIWKQLLCLRLITPERTGAHQEELLETVVVYQQQLLRTTRLTREQPQHEPKQLNLRMVTWSPSYEGMVARLRLTFSTCLWLFEIKG